MTDSLRGNSPSVDKVQVKTRALVQKCLARYPDKFAVFRELLQNADDAEAEVVQIAFQTKEYTAIIDKAGKIGIPENDLTKVRLVSGFFSVFGITDNPTIISGGEFNHHSIISMVQFSKEQHDHIRNNKVHNTIFGEENGLLCSEGQGRLFVVQRMFHFPSSPPFISDILLEWNEGLLYVGGFLLRLIYETAMDAVGNMTPDLAQLWGLFIMKSFAFQKSTPHPRVCEVLREAFFKCSTCNSIPVLSDVGIRDSKDVTLPDERYSPFMKQLPVLDDDINGHDLPIIKALLKRHSLLRFKYRWVIEILENQPLTTAEDRDSFFRWFMHEFKPPLQEKMSKFRDEIIRVAQLMHDNSDKVIKLKAIKRFISHDGWGSELQDDDALPSNTIPHSFTAQFGREVLRITFGWEALGIIEWIQNIICRPDIVDHHVSRVFRILQSQWSLLEPLHREKIVRLICETECIPTNLGRTTPEKAYFLESPQFRNLLHDLPLAQLSDIDPQLVEDLGFKQIIPWYHLKECLPKIACHTHQIAPYFGRAYGKMAEAEVKELQQMYIFASEEGELHRIGDLHIPDAEGLYLRLQLPIIQDSSGHNSQQALTPEEAKELANLDIVPITDLKTNSLKQNYDRENQYHGNSTEWHETLVIKHCRKVDLCKDLYLGDVRVAHQYTQALAGLEVKDEKHSVLWVKVENDPPTYKLWYDVAVAMCPVLIKTPNMQDKCTLATILEADLEALRVRGFDGSSFLCNCPSQDKPEAENKLEELDGKAAQGQERGTLPEAG
ncbi:hypothetical protein ID866_8038 [Astraeus odoratus]|nr:hypothetical protein ID866_8038 [Astraeus odoratus]